jgi:hypothetical protein
LSRLREDHSYSVREIAEHLLSTWRKLPSGYVTADSWYDCKELRELVAFFPSSFAPPALVSEVSNIMEKVGKAENSGMD